MKIDTLVEFTRTEFTAKKLLLKHYNYYSGRLTVLLPPYKEITILLTIVEKTRLCEAYRVECTDQLRVQQC